MKRPRASVKLLEWLAVEMVQATGEDIFYDPSFDTVHERGQGGSSATLGVQRAMSAREKLADALKSRGVKGV